MAAPGPLQPDSTALASARNDLVRVAAASGLSVEPGRATDAPDIEAFFEQLAAAEDTEPSMLARHAENYLALEGPYPGEFILVARQPVGGEIQLVAAITRPLSDGQRLWSHLFLGVGPAYRRRGLASAALGWLEPAARARAIGIAGKDPGGVLPLVLLSELDANATSPRRFLTARGYDHVRDYEYQVRPCDQPLPQRELPVGFTAASLAVQAAEEGQVASRLLVAHNDAFRDHWAEPPMPPDVWESWLSRKRIARAESVIITADGTVTDVGPREEAPEIAGYVVVARTRNPGEAYIGLVGITRAYRGRGLATPMIVEALRRIREAGFEFASLEVDSRNPTGAEKLYARLGFTSKTTAPVLAREFAGVFPADA